MAASGPKMQLFGAGKLQGEGVTVSDALFFDI